MFVVYVSPKGKAHFVKVQHTVLTSPWLAIHTPSVCIQLARTPTRFQSLERSLLYCSWTAIFDSSINGLWLFNWFFSSDNLRGSGGGDYNQAIDRRRGLDRVQARSTVALWSGTSIQDANLLWIRRTWGSRIVFHCLSQAAIKFCDRWQVYELHRWFFARALLFAAFQLRRIIAVFVVTIQLSSITTSEIHSKAIFFPCNISWAATSCGRCSSFHSWLFYAVWGKAIRDKDIMMTTFDLLSTWI